MPTLQLKKGSTLQHSQYTGLVGEVTLDTDKDVVVVHDGSTVGGFPLAKFSDIPTATSELTNDSNFINTTDDFTLDLGGL